MQDLLRLDTALKEPELPSRESVWAIVLAGGQGKRLRPLIRQVCGHDRPKQFANIIGSKSLLRHTLERVMLRIPPKQTVVVTCREHDSYVAEEFSGTGTQQILVQPEDRGTAAGILYPAHWIEQQEPEAIVAVFPSDHFILEQNAFMAHVLDVAAFVREHPSRLVLIGAPPSTPEPEYGWIQPGELLANAVHHVQRFWEKPVEDQARALMANGCLWNTFVFVARVETLLLAGRMFLPELTVRLAGIAARTAPWHSVERAFAEAPSADFSRAVLEQCPPFLAVSPLPALTWSDLGTPERVLQTLQLSDF